MKALIVFLTSAIFLLIMSCAKSVEPEDNYTFKVVKIREMPVDTFSSRGYGYVLRYVIVDRDYKINKILVDSIGELKVDYINEEGTAIFRLDEKYLPFTFLSLYKCEIMLDSMKGSYGYGGPITDTGGEKFIAVKGLK